MSDDFDFDDDEDIDLDDDFDGDDDELAASSSDVAPVDDDDVDDDDDASAPEKVKKPFDPNAKVPFFKNWIWWVSLVAAVPAGVLVTSIVLGAIDFGGQWNWMMWVVGGITFFCASAALVTPLLLALGFMLGGKEIKVAPAAARQSAEESLGMSDGDDDFDEDDFGDTDDEDMFDDDDDEEDDFDF